VEQFLGRHGIRLRQDDGWLFQIDLSLPQSRPSAVVVGARYRGATQRTPKTALHAGSQPAQLVVEFADVAGDAPLGPQLSWEPEFCEMPPGDSIPDWKEARRKVNQMYGA